AAAPDLPLRSVPAPQRPVTLELVHASAPAAKSVPPLAKTPEREPALAMVGAATEPEPVRRTPAKSAAPTTELPLFVKTMGPQELGAFAGLADTEDTEGTEDRAYAEDAEETAFAEDAEETEDAALPVQLPPAMRPLGVRRP